MPEHENLNTGDEPVFRLEKKLWVFLMTIILYQTDSKEHYATMQKLNLHLLALKRKYHFLRSLHNICFT